MQGRKENELKVEEKIKEKLSYYPKYLKEYYDSMEMEGKSYTTKRTYINHVANFLDFIEDEYDINIYNANSLNKVRPSMINSYFAGMKDTKPSIRACRLYSIKGFFSFMKTDGYIDSDPCYDMKAPKDNEEHDIVYLTKEEVEIVKKNIMEGVGTEYAKVRQRKWRNRDYAIVMIGFTLGLRATSITEINVEDINFETNELRITEKGNKTRTVIFGNKVREALENWLVDRERMLDRKGLNHESGALFLSQTMERMGYQAIFLMVKKYTYNIDSKHITPHKLRSTCATTICEETGDIQAAAYVLGHNNINTTRRYAEVSKDRKKKIAQLMDDIF